MTDKAQTGAGRAPAFPDPQVIPGGIHVYERLIETLDLVVVLHGVQAQAAGFMAGFFAVGPAITRFLSADEEPAARAGREDATPGAPVWSTRGPAAVLVQCALRPTAPDLTLDLSPFSGIYTTDRRRSHGWVWAAPIPRSGDVLCTVRAAGQTGRTVLDGSALRTAARAARRIRGTGEADGEGRR